MSRAALITSSFRMAGLRRVTLSATVPLNRNTSCNTTAIFERSASRWYASMGVSSIRICPLLTWYNLFSKLMMDVLPLPVCPTMAKVCPASSVKETSFNTYCSSL